MFAKSLRLIIEYRQQSGCPGNKTEPEHCLNFGAIKGNSTKMIGIEKYTLKDGQVGWQVSLSAKTQNQAESAVRTRRFSCARYGEQAFQKALEWFENGYYQTAG